MKQSIQNKYKKKLCLSQWDSLIRNKLTLRLVSRDCAPKRMGSSGCSTCSTFLLNLVSHTSCPHVILCPINLLSLCHHLSVYVSSCHLVLLSTYPPLLLMLYLLHLTPFILSLNHLFLLSSCPPVILSLCPPVFLSSYSQLSSEPPLILSSCHLVLLSSCPPVTLSSCHMSLLSSCLSVILSYCNLVSLSSWPPVICVLGSCHLVHLSSSRQSLNILLIATISGGSVAFINVIYPAIKKQNPGVLWVKIALLRLIGLHIIYVEKSIWARFILKDLLP